MYRYTLICDICKNELDVDPYDTAESTEIKTGWIENPEKAGEHFRPECAKKNRQNRNYQREK